LAPIEQLNTHRLHDLVYRPAAIEHYQTLVYAGQLEGGDLFGAGNIWGDRLSEQGYNFAIMKIPKRARRRILQPFEKSPIFAV